MHLDATGGYQSVCTAGPRLKKHRAEKLLEPEGGYQIQHRQINTAAKKGIFTRCFDRNKLVSEAQWSMLIVRAALCV